MPEIVNQRQIFASFFENSDEIYMNKFLSSFIFYKLMGWKYER